uniref:Mitochondrial arginine transporter BAC1-like n=1 Tax=Nelumbo nucifera TaxID=4432 RepID=A0A822Z4F1_NELNU|nr:TPA_asm: hypothetical protein HUJ06_007049 [Nelumbo nucifera]
MENDVIGTYCHLYSQLKGIFRGGTATLLRGSVGNAIFFSTYEYTRYYMYMQVNSASSVYSYLPNILIDAGIGTITGGLGGVAYWSVVLPFDVAKTVIHTAPDSTSSRNPFRILSSIYRMKGIKGCYTGIGPTLARAFPANAAAIVALELTAKLLGIRLD